MKQFLTSLRQTMIAGFFFLFPLYVEFIVISKAWTSLSSIGSKLAAMFGVKSILGLGGTSISKGLLIIAIWLVCGLLVRFTFVATVSQAAENLIARLVPGYATYRAAAEEKWEHKPKILPYTSVLLKQQNGWEPAFVVDQDNAGNVVLFLPDIPETNHGHVLLAPLDKVLLAPSLTANELDGILKTMGKGLLNKCEINLNAA